MGKAPPHAQATLPSFSPESQRSVCRKGNNSREKGLYELQVQLLDMVYRKALTLNSGDVAARGVGGIVNLVSNDVKKLEFLPVFMHGIWEAPMQARSVGQAWAEVWG